MPQPAVPRRVWISWNDAIGIEPESPDLESDVLATTLWGLSVARSWLRLSQMVVPCVICNRCSFIVASSWFWVVMSCDLELSLFVYT